MRAAVVDRYGPPEVVRIAEVPQPVPGTGQVRVRVVAAAVTTGDARIRGANFPPGFSVPARLAFGIRGPRRRILGGCYSGVVDAIGAGVADLAVGDAVCGMTGIAMGTHAEYVVVDAAKAVRKPHSVSHHDAVGVLFGGSAALHFVRDVGKVHAGTTLLVNGASGAIGTCAVQVAKHLGATVTAVTSGRNAQLVTELGADRVIDYTVTELSTLPDRFDVVFDTVGTLSRSNGKRLLADGGTLCLAAASLWDTVTAVGKVKAGVAPELPASFECLLGLVEAGELRVVIDRSFALDDIASAYRRVDSGRKVGNIVLDPADVHGGEQHVEAAEQQRHDH